MTEPLEIVEALRQFVVEGEMDGARRRAVGTYDSTSVFSVAVDVIVHMKLAATAMDAIGGVFDDKWMVEYAFDAVSAALQGKEPPPPVPPGAMG